MAHASDDHKDTPEVDSSASMKERKNSRLTPMPDYLMHWWTPVLFAFILLVAGCFLASIWRMPLRPVSWQKINPYWPPSWPFNYHWPSKDAMALCATIAGAGFAFSAWQQRSHDNAVRDNDRLDRERAAAQARAEHEEQRSHEETRRLEQIERDEYWKRREQIYQLLGSENPGLRLGAVALLAELADSAAHSTLLNKNEKQQLQRHIINTLCLQVRHEGLCNSSEGTEEEHAGMQKAIIEIISSRIRKPQRNSTVANWTKELIEITDSKILTPIRWKHITTEAIFNFQGTTFFESFVIIDSTIRWIEWDTSRFLKSLIIKSITHQTIIGTRTIPTQAKEALFTKVTFKLPETLNRFEMRMNPTSIGYQISVNSCTFIHRSCSCSNAAKCTCTNSVSQVPIVINFLKTDKALSSHAKHGTLQIKNCQTQDITVNSQSTDPQILLQNNTISGQLNIKLGAIDTHRRIDSIRYVISGLLTIRNNQISTNSTHYPIRLFTFPNDDFSRFLKFDNNTTFIPSNPYYQYPLHITKVDEASCSYHFKYSIPQPSGNAHVVSWTDGDQTTP